MPKARHAPARRHGSGALPDAAVSGADAHAAQAADALQRPAEVLTKLHEKKVEVVYSEKK